MEKLVYVLGKPDGETIEALTGKLRDELVGALKTAGAFRIRACLRDNHVEQAAHLRSGELAGDIWCYLSLWVSSRSLHPAIKALLAEVSDFQYGYAVAESEQLFHDWQPDGARVPGMNEVVLFRKPEHLTRSEFLKIWLESHTQLAIDTQSTFGYIQHIVGDKLDEDGPWFDTIVEENFPDDAMTSQEVFYDAVGDPEKYKRNEAAMIESVLRFIDLDTLERMPMSEYNF